MPIDKVLHVAAGVLIAVAGWWLFGAEMAVMLVLVAALGKEAWDARRHGHPDPYDAAATVVGGLIAAGLVWLL